MATCSMRLPHAVSRRPALCGGGAFPGCSALSPPQQQLLLLPPLPRFVPARRATMIRRPKRPYAFTQLVQLSDGSTYTVRTASPHALYRSVKDSRNHLLWQPSERSLRNVEADEAGRLAAFRGRFGRSWDAGAVAAPAPASPGSAEAAVPPVDNSAAGGRPGEAGQAAPAAPNDGGGDSAGRAPTPAAPVKEDAPYDPLADLISHHSSPDREKQLQGKIAKTKRSQKE
ncbi:hypothetical protein GGR56DRAFT_677835 [Xylariaceae sp. FL0804]|nr:hypothetical protein GGR56DRAFT_677835 [Xylariaceae sp. FL0804]